MSADHGQRAHEQHAFTRCENCGTALQGGYCHVCGQRAHNPLHSFKHAVEEVFESLWHLDGRIFRTMRDLLVPGRVAVNYLAGHRVRYIPPLRIFIILTLLTFFVAHFAINFDVDIDAGRTEISDAKTVAEAERMRDAAVKDLREARVETAEHLPLATGAIDTKIAAIERETAQRIRELEAAGADKTPATAPRESRQADRGAGSRSDDVPDSRYGAFGDDDRVYLQFGDRVWNPAEDDVAIAWLPDVFNRWATKKTRQAADNYKRLDTDHERLKDAWLRALPTSLFVMVPLFALLLKMLYLFTPRTYLEHLVVALYSHAWLMLAMLCLFVLADLVAIAGSVAWLSASLGLSMAAIWLWIPIYLFLMQKRVYRQHWLLTAAKFFVVGTVYALMLTTTIFAAAAVGLVQM